MDSSAVNINTVDNTTVKSRRHYRRRKHRSSRSTRSPYTESTSPWSNSSPFLQKCSMEDPGIDDQPGQFKCSKLVQCNDGSSSHIRPSPTRPWNNNGPSFHDIGNGMQRVNSLEGDRWEITRQEPGFHPGFRGYSKEPSIESQGSIDLAPEVLSPYGCDGSHNSQECASLEEPGAPPVKVVGYELERGLTTAQLMERGYGQRRANVLSQPPAYHSLSESMKRFEQFVIKGLPMRGVLEKERDGAFYDSKVSNSICFLVYAFVQLALVGISFLPFTTSHLKISDATAPFSLTLFTTVFFLVYAIMNIFGFCVSIRFRTAPRKKEVGNVWHIQPTHSKARFLLWVNFMWMAFGTLEALFNVTYSIVSTMLGISISRQSIIAEALCGGLYFIFLVLHRLLARNCWISWYQYHDVTNRWGTWGEENRGDIRNSLLFGHLRSK